MEFDPRPSMAPALAQLMWAGRFGSNYNYSARVGPHAQTIRQSVGSITGGGVIAYAWIRVMRTTATGTPAECYCRVYMPKGVGPYLEATLWTGTLGDQQHIAHQTAFVHNVIPFSGTLAQIITEDLSTGGVVEHHAEYLLIDMRSS